MNKLLFLRVEKKSQFNLSTFIKDFDQLNNNNYRVFIYDRTERRNLIFKGKWPCKNLQEIQIDFEMQDIQIEHVISKKLLKSLLTLGNIKNRCIIIEFYDQKLDFMINLNVLKEYFKISYAFTIGSDLDKWLALFAIGAISSTLMSDIEKKVAGCLIKQYSNNSIQWFFPEMAIKCDEKQEKSIIKIIGEERVKKIGDLLAIKCTENEYLQLPETLKGTEKKLFDYLQKQNLINVEM